MQSDHLYMNLTYLNLQWLSKYGGAIIFPHCHTPFLFWHSEHPFHTPHTILPFFLILSTITPLLTTSQQVEMVHSSPPSHIPFHSNSLPFLLPHIFPPLSSSLSLRTKIMSGGTSQLIKQYKISLGDKEQMTKVNLHVVVPNNPIFGNLV